MKPWHVIVGCSMAIVIGHAPAIIAEASAAPLCAHRSAAHAAQHHETRESDSRWHERHGQLPTCNLDKADDRDDPDNEPDDVRWRGHHDDKRDERRNDGDEDHNIPHRDHPGYHCRHFHCG